MLLLPHPDSPELTWPTNTFPNHPTFTTTTTMTIDPHKPDCNPPTLPVYLSTYTFPYTPEPLTTLYNHPYVIYTPVLGPYPYHPIYTSLPPASLSSSSWTSHLTSLCFYSVNPFLPVPKHPYQYQPIYLDLSSTSIPISFPICLPLNTSPHLTCLYFYLPQLYLTCPYRPASLLISIVLSITNLISVLPASCPSLTWSAFTRQIRCPESPTCLTVPYLCCL